MLVVHEKCRRRGMQAVLYRFSIKRCLLGVTYMCLLFNISRLSRDTYIIYQNLNRMMFKYFLKDQNYLYLLLQLINILLTIDFFIFP